ncbi:MAG: hypothetical protein QF404_12340, partial [Planctomycetota bacterium]|nr:hypothetical protein [Planctomycetota bacterium]
SASHESPTAIDYALLITSVTELGWEAALSRFVGMQDKQELYAAFSSFLGWSIEDQLAILDDLKN